MRTRVAIAVLSTVLLAGCTWPGPPSPTSMGSVSTLSVVSVSDGDTFTALDTTGARIRIRLLGIDATTDPVADPVDRFGRHLAYVNADGHDVALTLIQTGMPEAWYPASEPNTRYRTTGPQYEPPVPPAPNCGPPARPWAADRAVDDGRTGVQPRGGAPPVPTNHGRRRGVDLPASAA